MFLGTQSGDQPWDIKTTPNDLVDGASQTLLLGENTLTGHSTGSPLTNRITTGWTCPLPNFAMFLGSDNVCDTPGRPGDCLAGQLAPRPGSKDGPGWTLANRPGTFENINYGQNLNVEGSFPFATSGHRGRANFVFCDGSLRVLSATIDGSVYAQLITPAGSLLPPAIGQVSRASELLPYAGPRE
jgi:prepilin-type processing-associated H-X9-DG protein